MDEGAFAAEGGHEGMVFVDGADGDFLLGGW